MTETQHQLYFDWAKYDAFQIRGGKFKQPFGLEELISSNNITMMERSYLDQTVPGKKIGMQVMGAPTKGMTYALSTYQHNDNERDLNGDGYLSGAGRLTFNFAEMMGDKESVMHLGVAGLENNYSATATSSSQTDTTLSSTARATIQSFRSAGRGLNNIFRAQIHGESLGASSLASSLEFGAKVQQRAYGLEGIFARGPMKVMGEYSGGQYEASQTVSQMNFDTKTGYVEIGYFITGEKYADSYKNGVFGGFKPKNNFDLDKGDLGAIELAFRAEGYRVDDTSYSGSTNSRFQGTLSGPTGNGVTSKATTYTAGIRWLLNPNAVVKVNYAYTKLGNNYAPIDLEQSSGAANSADVGAESLFMTRLQYMF